jgi:preprotein translocase subunit SecE
MARQTRAQRRARRAEAAAQDGAQVARPARAAQQQQQQPAVRTAPSARVAPTERQLPGSRGRRFVAESMAELKKVEWPNQNQLIQCVVVVLIACIVVGLYLWGADQVFKPLVQKVFLR